MATTTIDAGNVYITDGSISATDITTNGSQIVVKIDTTKVDFNLDNPVVALPDAGGSSKRLDTSKVPFSRVIDLKRIKEVVSVQGHLINETTERAITKRDNLITLMRNKGQMSVVWGLGNYQTKFIKNEDTVAGKFGLFINKLSFSEVSGHYGEDHTDGAGPERAMDVQVQMIRGQDMIVDNEQ